jgi:hypothetical protein
MKQSKEIAKDLLRQYDGPDYVTIAKAALTNVCMRSLPFILAMPLLYTAAAYIRMRNYACLPSQSSASSHQLIIAAVLVMFTAAVDRRVVLQSTGHILFRTLGLFIAYALPLVFGRFPAGIMHDAILRSVTIGATVVSQPAADLALDGALAIPLQDGWGVPVDTALSIARVINDIVSQTICALTFALAYDFFTPTRLYNAFNRAFTDVSNRQHLRNQASYNVMAKHLKAMPGGGRDVAHHFEHVTQNRVYQVPAYTSVLREAFVKSLPILTDFIFLTSLAEVINFSIILSVSHRS